MSICFMADNSSFAPFDVDFYIVNLFFFYFVFVSLVLCCFVFVALVAVARSPLLLLFWLSLFICLRAGHINRICFMCVPGTRDGGRTRVLSLKRRAIICK